MRYLTTTDDKPVNSEKRAPIPAEIPPFSFVGETEVGISNFWSPKYNTLLTKGYAQAQGLGTSDLGLTFMCKEPLNPSYVLLGSAILVAEKSKIVFSFNNSINQKIIHPYDEIFVAVWSNSGHEGLVVQMLGEKIL